MKRCGRLNSVIGFRRYPRWDSASSRFHEQWRLKLPFFCTLTTFAVVFAAAPAFASINSGSTPQLSSDSMVYAFGTGDSPDDATEIPQAVPSTAASSAQSTAAPESVPGQKASSADYDDGIIRYEHAKDSDEMSGPPIGSLDDFMSEGNITSPLGFVVREDKRRLKSGREVDGLLIVDVFAGSPAAHAGLHPYRQTVRDALETAAIAGAMFCPPVVLLVPVFDQVHVGESYDLIIGIDGSRVTNFLDFEDHLRDVQAGEIVYFSIVRNGERMQVPVSVPDNLADPTF
jgi:hypothetical protein